MTNFLLDPQRGYPDIVRQDSSVTLRGKIQAFWGTGEQLWDVDLNNNLIQIGTWLNISVDRYRAPLPPYPPYTPLTPYSTLSRSNGTPQPIPDVGTPPHGPQILIGDVVTITPSTPDITMRRPFIGATMFVKADWMYRVWTGVAWKPFLYTPPFRKRIEINVYVSAAKPNSEAVRYVVDAPFRIVPVSPTSAVFDPDDPEPTIDTAAAFCNVVGAPSQNSSGLPPVAIWLKRNGIKVGQFVNIDVGRRLMTAANLEFQSGDVLTVTCTRTMGDAAFSIVGERI